MLHRLDRLFAPAPGYAALHRRRRVLQLCLWLLWPLVLAFGTSDVLAGRTAEGTIVLAIAAAIALGLAVLLRTGRVKAVARAMALLGAAALSVLLAIDGGDGTSFIFFYFFPLVVLWVLGNREGLAVALASLALAALFMLVLPATQPYYAARAPDYLATYAVMIALAYGMETSRRMHQAALLAEKHRAEDALAEVERLRGLLPICAWCKRVRDENGTWEELERYFSDRADVLFSHGVCTDCARALEREYDL